MSSVPDALHIRRGAALHTVRICDARRGERTAGDLTLHSMTSNVIPLRPRRITENELIAYRMITQGWSEAMKRLLLPAYFAAEAKQRGSAAGSNRP